MNEREKTAFIKVVYGYYKKLGRHDLPWRKTRDPYKIAVSELMLQQTQVTRVIEKYKEFLKAFPTMKALAEVPLQQVLLVWSGLGYNRRARFLQRMAQAVTEERKGKFPKEFNELLTLPGIGHYTAGAISAFAYNIPVSIIETNIRTVYLHHFYHDSEVGVSDKDLMVLIEETLDKDNPREWYWALMDYGSHLKASGIKIHRNSAQYKKQSTFKGSLREVRGGIMKILTTYSATAQKLHTILSFDMDRIEKALEQLMKEEFIVKKGKTFSIK
ncbi:MAG: endonuclease family protein [Candidatus Nomurabacteria bacterium]|nr:endonuclease family protein [Candidatus Nomurabacteria bacterium]